MASGNNGRAQSVMMVFVYLILLFRTDGHLEGSLKHLLHNGFEVRVVRVRDPHGELIS
ncbi:hypothetical protein NEUTE1DRAFT_135102 [Neurospora tetrasperma FGSC 2508]|uniref:Uncharacterized protein n=1 Tax=Neurospora tetrasperma (strain FGSC 2508 / ATCC MYA-4615 / P0657) TaxID=510951 RepID=F8MBL2_NEUT8|nr:uncharacterized protein NEUTE1DRAFT_135102 [Neurospora tetrasperma FGSC 2508]EGO61124.1 hypothetical protein NEUTE1DRAFT_135102 [Neurospora tetrasperma FGSC 2508]EGZ74871.1 hypothetical protein NEUTE2DRAFT_163814 [Neurospora tetrasperma FGSC 2509]